MVECVTADIDKPRPTQLRARLVRHDEFTNQEHRQAYACENRDEGELVIADDANVSSNGPVLRASLTDTSNYVPMAQLARVP
jgi:hypothetical protein